MGCAGNIRNDLDEQTQRNKYIEKIYRENNQRLRAFVSRISHGNKEYIEEICQEVWLAITNHRERIDHTRPIFPYLCGTARYMLLNRLRKTTIERRFCISPYILGKDYQNSASMRCRGDSLDLPTSHLQSSHDIEFSDFYYKELIYECMKVLTDSEKQTFIDWYIRRMTHSKIAELRGITIGASKMKKRRLAVKLIQLAKRWRLDS